MALLDDESNKESTSMIGGKRMVVLEVTKFSWEPELKREWDKSYFSQENPSRSLKRQEYYKRRGTRFRTLMIGLRFQSLSSGEKYVTVWTKYSSRHTSPHRRLENRTKRVVPWTRDSHSTPYLRNSRSQESDGVDLIFLKTRCPFQNHVFPLGTGELTWTHLKM